MAHNACNVCTAAAVNSEVDSAACSCSHCDIKDASEKLQELTCSCEDCTEAKTCLYYTKSLGGLSANHPDICCANMQNNRPANPPPIKESISTSLSQICKNFKPPTTSPITPSGVYGVMTATMQHQESIVGLQKWAYLPKLPQTKPKKECLQGNCSCIGDHVYRIMTATRLEQESIVGLQKKAYLPDSESNPKNKCILEKCTCISSDPCGNTQSRHKKESPDDLCGPSFASGVPKIYHIQELPNYFNSAAGYVFDVPDICCDKQESPEVPTFCCDKQESPDLMKGSAGYVFEVPTFCCDKQESPEIPKICGNIQNRDKKESSGLCGASFASEVPKIYHIQDLPNYYNSVAGYVLNVPEICCYKRESSEVPSETNLKKKYILEKCTGIISDTCGNIQNRDNKELPNVYGASFASEVPKIYYIQELPDNCNNAAGYVFDVPKICCDKLESFEVPKICHKQKPLDLMKCAAGYVCDVPKICCDKQEPLDLMKGAAGYVFDVPKFCCHKKESSQVPRIYHKQDSPDPMQGAAGYVFDVPKTCCDKQESPGLMKGATGYVFDVPKICCDKQESPGLMKGAEGYVFDVPKICCDKQESPGVMKGAAGYVFDLPKICCDKQESLDLMKGAAGYIFDVPKFCCHKKESPQVPRSHHKQESPDPIQGAAGYVFDVPKICCDKQESPDNLNGAAGYVFDVPKICCDKQESPDHLNGVADYVFELLKTYKELSKKAKERQCCKENKIESHKKKTTNVCNMCNAPESSSSSSSETKTARLGSENSTQVFNISRLGSTRTASDTLHICCKTKNKSDSQQYKPTNNAQGLFKNILETQENALSGYVYELPKYSPTTQKKSCECDESVKKKSASHNISESSGCVTELQTCRNSLHEQAKNTRNIATNRLKAKEVASDSRNKLIKKKSCRGPGYVWEVQKYSPKHCDHIKKQKCDCKEFAKYKSDKLGYDLEQKNKISNRSFTEPVKRKPKLPECAYDVPISSEIDNTERVWTKSSECKCKKKSGREPCAHEPAKCIHKLPSQKNSCAFRESVKNKPASPEYAHELTKCTNKPQSQKSNSECRESVSKAGKIPLELQGYVYEVPKESCTCSKSGKKYSKSPHEAANNAEVLSIHRLESKCIPPDIQNICKSMVGTQTNTIDVLESLDLRHPASKYTNELCNEVFKNQTETIEVLKKIYLAQKSKEVSTCCSQNFTELCDGIKKFKNAATSGTGNLSAEVLFDMPDAELNDCLSCRQSNISNKPRKITKSDIIKRLKEAYKACSCKICDCFASKPVKTETNEQPLCSCKPCDCVQCTRTLAEQCHCKPCQCGDCKTRSIRQSQNFLVAPVLTEENVPRVACTCSPCACIECGLIYPLSSSIVNEMSTSTNRHALCRCEICLNESCDQSGLDSCKCQKYNKFMSKPVEHDTHEFDIRTARIEHNTPIFQRLGKNDTIAMFAAIPCRYPTFDGRLSNRQTCSCKECEFFCICPKNAISAIKSSQLFSTNKAKSNSDSNDRYNNCELKMPYECQLYKKIQRNNKCCVSDTCGCLDCETSNTTKNLHRFGRNRYSDGYERTSRKEKPGTVLHTFKKGDVLPPTHKLNVQNLFFQKQNLEELSCSIPKVTTNTNSTSKARDVDIFHELTSEFNTSNRKTGSITQTNLYMKDFNTRYIHKCKTFKCDACMHYQERNKRRSLHKNIAIDNEVSGSCFSDRSSSYYKRYGSNTLISRNKSKESSCNSLGYNYPEYFIQFPKGTAETSTKDVMLLDMDESIKPDKCNIIQNSTGKHNVPKKSYDNMSGNENSCEINECNHFSNDKLIARPSDSNNNNSENAHIASMCHNCKINSLHVQLNNQNEKCKNCGNIVLQTRERNELLNSACLTGSQSSLNMNHENREYINAIHDFNEFHVARNVYYNISEGNTSRYLLPIHDKRYTWENSKQTTHSDFNCAEILNVPPNYKRVRNTLMEAKTFSLELIRLLKSYEKANDEFESISGKLKFSHPI